MTFVALHMIFPEVIFSPYYWLSIWYYHPRIARPSFQCFSVYLLFTPLLWLSFKSPVTSALDPPVTSFPILHFQPILHKNYLIYSPVALFSYCHFSVKESIISPIIYSSRSKYRFRVFFPTTLYLPIEKWSLFYSFISLTIIFLGSSLTLLFYHSYLTFRNLFPPLLGQCNLALVQSSQEVLFFQESHLAYLQSTNVFPSLNSCSIYSVFHDFHLLPFICLSSFESPGFI